VCRRALLLRSDRVAKLALIKKMMTTTRSKLQAGCLRTLFSLFTRSPPLEDEMDKTTEALLDASVGDFAETSGCVGFLT
tara:strand:+ start:9686 stop:9922 length:237 start_codon:yes stop_codon:yes gene_type:complete